MTLKSFPILVVLTGGLAACGMSNSTPGMSSIDSVDIRADQVMTAERAALSVPPPQAAKYVYQRGSLWHTGPTGLLGDKRARALGDILTITIEIDDEAEFQNSTTRDRQGSESADVGAFFGLGSKLPGAFDSLNPSLEMGSSSTFSGDGSTSRNEKLTLRVAATVVEVMPNGHLVIQGDQEVRVNNELRDLQVVGIVRPADISRHNEISYDRIAGARISYGGRGQITTAQQPRYGQRTMDRVMPY